MTIKELINLLQSYPEDMIVVNADNDTLEEEYIYMLEEFYNGDSANPNCEVLYNVLKID